MGAILDLIGSYVFKAAMIGIILSTSISLNNVMVEKAQLTNLEKNINVAMSVVEWDMINIGYNYAGTPFTKATRGDVIFYADVQNDGAVDLVRYDRSRYTVAVGDSFVTRYKLTRTVNGVGNDVMTRLISYRHDYFDRNGNSTTTLSAIKGIRITVEAESPVLVDGESLIARRQFTIYPANLALTW